MNIADRIQNLRKSKGISQEELADKIGVSRQAVSKWESEQSIPDLDKVIVMSDFFEVTTDYILKGIETEKQVTEKNVNAVVFVFVATALNCIGLIFSCAIWHDNQTAMAIVGGLIFMVMGCMVFGIGFTYSSLNREKSIRLFWAINIWILSFIPLSCLYNVMGGAMLAPYPLMFHPILALIIPVVIYITICLTVTLKTNKKFHNHYQ